MLQGWIGVFSLMVGIGFVATDPGEKVEEGGGGVQVQWLLITGRARSVNFLSVFLTD